MQRFLVFFGVLLQALACMSIYVPACGQGNGSDQIFIGTVIEERAASGTFLFHIDEPLKGIASGTDEIEIGPGPCGAGYQTGERYLVLVRSGWGTPGEPAGDAGDSIDFFRSLARGEHVTFIKGRIAENVEDSRVRYEMDVEHRPGLHGVEITASKEGQKYKVFTQHSGTYSLRVPEAGTFQVTAKLSGHATTDLNYEVEVAPDSCRELDVGMWTACRVTGPLVGADGQPAAGRAPSCLFQLGRIRFAWNS